MNRFFMVALVLCALSLAGAHAAVEHVVVSGGPALRKFEKFKVRTHDVYWGNFVDSALIRLGALKSMVQEGDRVAWLVYRPAYSRRSAEQGEDLVAHVKAKADAMGVLLYWFDTSAQLVNYLNKGVDRTAHPIAGLDFFGHSNKVNWMFDYSNEVDGCSVVFLHTRDLAQIERSIFASGAVAQSWGCHSGEYYTQKFMERTGVKMWGAVGKTDYSAGGLPELSGKGGRWAQ